MGRKAKLSPDQVHNIIMNPNNRSLKEFAQHFGVSVTTIHNAKNFRGTTYKNLEADYLEENEVQAPA